MCKRLNHADQPLGARRKRRSVAATGCGASAFLTIPKLEKTVLPLVKPSANDQRWMGIANLCASLVDDDFQVSTDATAQQIVNATLAAWASKHCADIQLLDHFNFVVALDDETLGLEAEGEDCDTPNQWLVALEAGQNMNYIVVDEKLLELESEFCGLGRTAISIAEQASFRTFTVFSPGVAQDIGSYIYWQGETTDADVIETWMSEGMEEGDWAENFLPSHFREPIPDVFFEGGNMSKEELQNIADSNRGNTASEVAKVILSIMDLLDQKAGLPNLQRYDADTAFFSCILGISADNDPLSRVIDDHFEWANSDSDRYTAFYGVTQAPFEAEAFQQWRVEMEKGFLLYSKLDQLIRLLKKGG